MSDENYKTQYLERFKDGEFKSRLRQHYDEMRSLYLMLYGDEIAFRYFCDMLYDCYKKRPESLKQRDKKRKSFPEWYRGNDMLGMVMYVQCFSGTLRGIQNNIGYLKECEINYLHLMPLLLSPREKSDGGFAVSDFRKVEPQFGTMEDLLDLSETCHRDGISICLDFVMNHTSEEHEWARRARAGEKEYQDRYFFYDNWDIPNQFEKTLPQVFPETAPGNFTWCEQAGKVVMTTFHPYQWDLNYRNCVVFNDMVENMLFLSNHGADIIRLDAVPYIWKTLGTNSRNLPEVHTLVRIMHMACEIVCPGTLLLGEVVMEPVRVFPYFGSEERPECHMLYNVTTMASTWNTVATADTRLLRHQLEAVFSLPKQYIFLNYLRCHDDIGWGLDYDFLKQFGIDETMHKKYLNDYFTGKWPGSDARGELYNDAPMLGDARLCGTTASLCGIEEAENEGDEKKLALYIRLHIMLHAFLLTQSGIPVFYSGDEIGKLNDNTYHLDPLKREDSRYLHRGIFSFNEADKRKQPDTREAIIFTGLQKLVTIRKRYDVFKADADMWILDTGDDAVLGIGRYFNGEKMLAFFNFSKNAQTVHLGEEHLYREKYQDMINQKEVSPDKLKIDAYDFAWLLATRG